MRRISIPKEVGGMPILNAVSLYHDDFGWVIHPLKGPSGGGKKPITTDWRKLDTTFLTPEKKTDYFDGSEAYNIGTRVRFCAEMEKERY